MNEQNRKTERFVFRFDIDLNPRCIHCGTKRSEHFKPGPDADSKLAARWCPRRGGGFESLSFKAVATR